MLRASLSDFVDRTRHRRLAEGVCGIPGVAGAAVFDAPLFANVSGDAGGFRSPDGGPAPQPAPSLLRVGSGFFTATGMTLVAGRVPSDPELDSGAPVIAVSETLAARYWPGEDPIGQTLRYGKTENRVVGGLRDVRIVAMDVQPAGTIFARLSPRAAGVHLFVAFGERPDTVIGQIVARMPEIDPIARVRGKNGRGRRSRDRGCVSAGLGLVRGCPHGLLSAQGDRWIHPRCSMGGDQAGGKAGADECERREAV